MIYIAIKPILVLDAKNLMLNRLLNFQKGYAYLIEKKMVNK